MSLDLFQLHLPRVQLYYVLTRGAYLAIRRGHTNAIKLYPCAEEGHSFFVEVSTGDGRGKAMVRKSFVSSVPVEDYSHWGKLSEWET